MADLTDDQKERLRNIKATAEQVTRSNLGPVDDVFHDAAWAAGIAITALEEIERLREKDTAWAVRWQEQYDRAEKADAEYDEAAAMRDTAWVEKESVEEALSQAHFRLATLIETVRGVAKSLTNNTPPIPRRAWLADRLHTACDQAEGQG